MLTRPISPGLAKAIAVAYGFPESPGADYADRLHLVLIDRYWLIDDVSYASGAPSLRGRLEEIACDAKKMTCSHCKACLPERHYSA